MLGLLTATRRCQGRLWGIINQPKSNHNNFSCKPPLCSPFYAATTLYTETTPWKTPNLTPNPQETLSAATTLYTKPTPWTAPNLTPNLQETNPSAEIVFFNLGTTFPKKGEKTQVWEFGALVLCADTLSEKEKGHVIRIRPSLALEDMPKKMRDEGFSTSRSFADVAPEIFNILDGRIWAAHNLRRFHARLIREAFQSIGQIPPVDIGIIDTLILFRNYFPVKNNKLCTIAKYLGSGTQKHRSLPDALLTVDVFTRAATVDFLRSEIPELAPPEGRLASSWPSKTPGDASSTSKKSTRSKKVEI